MTRIVLDGVSVDFPIYQGVSRSFRIAVFEAVGGKLEDHNQRCVVSALKDVTFELAEGDRLGLVGHNGAGKTTLLRVISGVYPPTQGKLWINGSISALTDLSLGIDNELTGRENIINRLILLGHTFRSARELSREIEEFSELGGFLDLPMRTYSSGMSLRLAYSVATCMTPEILILDEMVSAGDAAFMGKVKKRTREFLDRTKILVLASHNLAMLKEYCNKGLWLDHGAIKEFGEIDAAVKGYRAASAVQS